MQTSPHDSSVPPAWAAWTATLAARLTAGVKVTGLWFGAFNVALMIAILVQISIRHFFTGGHQIILGELQWHLYATAMMFGLAYSQAINSHVRVDVFSRNWTPQRRAAIEIFGNLFLIMPFVVIIFLQGLDYVSNSWRVSEGSDSPVGLPWRWLIKSVIPASFALWFVALLARVLRDAVFLLAPTALSANELEQYNASEDDSADNQTAADYPDAQSDAPDNGEKVV